MHQRLPASIALVLLAAPAGAERLEYGARSEAFWTDNQAGTAQDVAGGGALRFAPWAEVADAEGRLTWGLRYAPTYNYYFDQASLSGFDQDVSGRFGWHLDDRTTFRASDRFTRYQSVTSFNEQAAPGEDIIPLSQNQLFSVNSVSGSLDHWLGPLDRVSLSLSQSLYDYSDENQLDHSYLGTNLSYDHTLSERASVGTRISWARQTTDRLDVPDDVTDYYNLSGSLTYSLSPTMQFSLSGGPAMIVGNANDFVPPDQSIVAQFPLRRETDGAHFLDADTCPEESPGVHVIGPKCKSIAPALTANQIALLNFVTDGNQITVPFAGAVPSADNSNLTYFASSTLSKQWERWSAAFSYTRSAGQTTTIASVSDIVSGSLHWRIAQRWTADFAGSYELREQASHNFVLSTQVANQPTPLPKFSRAAGSSAVRAVEVDNGAGVDVLTLNLRVAYQLARRASLYLTTDYSEQSGAGSASSLQQASRLALYVGVDYFFDPVNF